jgi:hypothetical protein
MHTNTETYRNVHIHYYVYTLDRNAPLGLQRYMHSCHISPLKRVSNLKSKILRLHTHVIRSKKK